MRGGQVTELVKMLADLLSESYAAENNRTATPVRAFAIRSKKLGSLREATMILANLAVQRSQGAVWNWVYRLSDYSCDPLTTQTLSVAVNKIAVKINGE